MIVDLGTEEASAERLRHLGEHGAQRDQEGDHGEEGRLEAAIEIVGARLAVLFELGVDARHDCVRVLLEAVERVLDGLLDGLLDVLAHLLDLVDAPRLLLLQGRHEYGEHLEAGFVEARPLADLLHDLHEHLLAVGVRARLVGLGQVEVNLAAVVFVELLDEIERALAQRLADRVEEDKDEIGYFTHVQYGLVNIERILSKRTRCN